ncbi:hypothetical protein [Nocardia sp. JMUB6875]|uniref:hypothetical protein n=1 Tax=Nocardia sp. JMUB6875 TaxID=3158170 RepID=UPI0034E85B88
MTTVVASTTATASVDPLPGIGVQAPPSGGFVVGTPVTVYGMVLIGGVSFLPGPRYTFTDNGSCFYAKTPLGQNASQIQVTWIPTTAGSHTLTVTQNGHSDSTTVTVVAAPAGTAVPTPSTPGCSSSGSAGTGSLGF